MLVNLVPEFLAAHSAPDPTPAYHDYLDRHRPVLGAYWQTYVLDLASRHAEPIIATAVAADRADLKHLLESVDVVAVAEDAMRRSLEQLEADCPVDQIGRAHVLTPVTVRNIVCRLLLEKKRAADHGGSTDRAARLCTVSHDRVPL